MRSNIRFFLALALSSLGLAALGTGCNSAPSVRQVCELLCSCGQECTDSALNDCVTNGEAQQKSTEDAGCADTHAELRQCLVDNFECAGGGAQLPAECVTVADEVDTCLGEPEPG